MTDATLGHIAPAGLAALAAFADRLDELPGVAVRVKHRDLGRE